MLRSKTTALICRAAGLASLSDALGPCAAVDFLSGWFQRCGDVLRCVVDCELGACGFCFVG